MTADTVLITGAASGIGRATAQIFADNGWTVYATDRDENALAGLSCRAVELDVTSGADIDRVVDRIIEEQGRIDCLVNNAGYGQFGAVEDIPTDHLHRQFDVNVYGPHRLVRAVLPHMRDREEGTIVNVSSVLGRLSVAGTGTYSGSKFALEAMSDALREEVADLGIDVVLVEPGAVETEFYERGETELERGIERRPVYDWVYETLADARLLADGGPLAIPPTQVAAAIHDAASVSDPEARYVVGRGARLLIYSQYLPDRITDAILGLARRLA